MEHWLAISNRDNSKVVIKNHIWGVPKRHINTISKTKPGDTLLVYVGQQVIDRDTTLPPAITGCFEITSEVYEDTKPIFTAPPKLGAEVFPLRIKLQTHQDLRSSDRIQTTYIGIEIHHQQDTVVRAHSGPGNADHPRRRLPADNEPAITEEEP
ncbi:MAG: EVE domain-containing protein [Methanoculleus sp.]